MNNKIFSDDDFKTLVDYSNQHIRVFQDQFDLDVENDLEEHCLDSVVNLILEKSAFLNNWLKDHQDDTERFEQIYLPPHSLDDYPACWTMKFHKYVCMLSREFAMFDDGIMFSFYCKDQEKHPSYFYYTKRNEHENPKVLLYFVQQMMVLAKDLVEYYVSTDLSCLLKKKNMMLDLYHKILEPYPNVRLGIEDFDHIYLKITDENKYVILPFDTSPEELISCVTNF